MLGLSSRQVQAAIDYIDQHRDEVRAEYGKIMERICRGNPAAVQQRLQKAREKFQQMMANQQQALDHARDHGGQ